ncbi:hypothetical protein ONS95_001584 [Cadophora gregata]|uniref:uncharacterized protein n=1 Tax=Cadophora gregata TaxID=51156 RepID=UPI0026DCA6F0|nr:uncharacterized protein ONS95_001584 [Cadophora gregata]KAK0111209.1 hypothetical protein ONS95_001584 [Cadophora gregata]
MATSSTNQAQLVTFHQWVARRIQSFDFAAHPVTSAGWTWTLDSDLESYVIDYLAHGRSEAEVTECLSFRNLVRDAPSPSSMTAEHREERERRLLYGKSPEPSETIQTLSMVLDSQVTTGRYWQDRLQDGELAAGISRDDVAPLLQVRELIGRNCWIMLTLNNMTLHQTRELNAHILRQQAILIRMQPIINQNRMNELDRALQQALQDLEADYEAPPEQFTPEFIETTRRQLEAIYREQQEQTESGIQEQCEASRQPRLVV